MMIHNFGLGGAIPRPVLLLLWFKNRNLSRPVFKKFMKTWAKSPLKKADVISLLDSFGGTLARDEKSIFGNAPLPPTTSPKKVGIRGPSAPLIDTGELRDAVRYVNSIDHKLKKVR